MCALLLLSLPVWAQEKKLELSDLGFSKQETVADPKLQQELEVRSSKLQTHQKLGLLTQALMTAAFLTGSTAKEGRNETHQYLGMATGAAYFTTAYYSLTAPKPSTVKDKGWNVRLHKALAWIHFPLMILTPIAGMQAMRDNRRHHESTGLASHKGELGTALFATFTLSTTLMFIEF